MPDRLCDELGKKAGHVKSPPSSFARAAEGYKNGYRAAVKKLSPAAKQTAAGFKGCYDGAPGGGRECPRHPAPRPKALKLGAALEAHAVDLGRVAEMPVVIETKRIIGGADHLNAGRHVGLHLVHLGADGEGVFPAVRC